MKQSDERDFYRKLGSPIRREIVRLLGERGQMGATELNQSVNISAGRFYYHLDFLGDLVTRDKNRKYILTERGKLACQMLMGNNIPERSGGSSSVGSSIIKYTAPNSVVTYILRTRIIALPLAFSILALALLAQSSSHLLPRLLSLVPSSGTSLAISVGGFVTNFLVVFAFCVVASYAFRRRDGNLELFVGVALSYVPISIFSLLCMWIPLHPTNGILGAAVFTIFQLWSMLILTATMSTAKRMTYATSGLIVLSLVYISSLLTRFSVI